MYCSQLIKKYMQTYTMTKFRLKLFQVADSVLKTGVPIEVVRGGKKLLFCLPEGTVSKLSKLKRRHSIRGNPEDLVNLQVGEWNELKNLR